jgi:predicted AAA+ superfamily ATPase
VDLLDPELQRSLAARPERLREIIEGEPSRKTVVIDEVQRAPALLDVVHGFVESRQRLRFVLTGSSARKLRHGAANLLAGRLIECRMHPFMAAELGAAFDLSRALTLGMIPLVLASSNPEATLRSYAALYVREEVQAEALVRNSGDFSRFLEAVALSHGSVLSVSDVARECAVMRKTVEGYIGVAEDLLLCFRLPVFTRRAKRRLVAHSKFYFVDPGLYRSLRPTGPLDAPGEIGGAALEGLVAEHLRAWIDYGGSDARLHYWRTREGNEVDFVVYGRDCFWALEVKSAAEARPADLRGLRSFRDDYPKARTALLYMGARSVTIDGIRCVPCERFLRSLVPGEVPEALA